MPDTLNKEEEMKFQHFRNSKRLPDLLLGSAFSFDALH